MEIKPLLHLQTVTYLIKKRYNKWTKNSGVCLLVTKKWTWSRPRAMRRFYFLLSGNWEDNSKGHGTSLCQTFHFLCLCQAVWIALMSFLQTLSSCQVSSSFYMHSCEYLFICARQMREKLGVNKNQKQVGVCLHQPGHKWSRFLFRGMFAPIFLTSVRGTLWIETLDSWFTGLLL